LTRPASSERNSEIVRLIDEELMTKTAVGKLYKISKQRVWQIYRKDKESVQNIRPARNW
jgi:DNA invertase Pin-like site-specific DNA recombinase